MAGFIEKESRSLSLSSRTLSERPQGESPIRNTQAEAKSFKSFLVLFFKKEQKRSASFGS
jgi:hypothetical protein